MTARTETYAPVRPIPYLLQIGVVQTIECPVRHGETGALVAPDNTSKITVEKPDGTELVSSAVVTSVTGSVASYDLDLTSITTADLGTGWTIWWPLDFGGVTYPPFRFDAYAT